MNYLACFLVAASLSTEMLASTKVCYWEQGTFGVDLSCPSGFVGTGACGSGMNADCHQGGRFYTSLKCCYMTGLCNTATNCNMLSGSKGVELSCSSQKAVFGLCGSGMNPDCAPPNIWNKLKCCSSSKITINSNCNWQYGTFGTYLSCADGRVLTGICGSGQSPDCPHNSYHGIKCCSLAWVNKEGPYPSRTATKAPLLLSAICIFSWNRLNIILLLTEWAISAGIYCPQAKGNIFLHWPTNSVSKSFIALLTNPNNFIEKTDPTQQDSLAESSCELTPTSLVSGDYILSSISHKIGIFYWNWCLLLPDNGK